MRLLLLLLPLGLLADKLETPEEWQLQAPDSFSLTCNKGKLFDKDEVLVRYEKYGEIVNKWSSPLSYRGMLDDKFISNGGIFKPVMWRKKDDDNHYFGERIGLYYHVRINRETLAITINQPPSLGSLRTTLACKFIDDDKAIKRQQKLWIEWEKKMKQEKERLKNKNKI